MGTLFVAAGGGGDAVAILLAQRLLAPEESSPPTIATCAWERLIIDPVPGPRGPEGFSGLRAHDGVFEVTSDSETVPSGRSMLPRLVHDSGARVFLLDLAAGVPAVAEQLRAAAAVAEADRIIVVDSGGDAIATGAEPTLRSPLADAMGVASALAVGLPVELAVIGPGADGELSEAEVVSLLNHVGAHFVGDLGEQDVARVDAIMRWHPTEASALIAAAACGRRPVVAMRRGGTPFQVTERTAGVWAFDPATSVPVLAGRVAKAGSLESAAVLLGSAGMDELAYERAKASGLPVPRQVRLEQLAADVAAGATHVTLRRARELTGENLPRGIHGGVAIEEDLPGVWRIRVAV